MSRQLFPPLADAARITCTLGDPVNRHVRYPAARWLLPAAIRTGLTPNQITWLHTAIGLAAAASVAQGTAAGLLVGAVLGEVRLVLDCLDGVVARARKLSSPYGRTLDALGDAVAYIALCIAVTRHAHVHLGSALPVGRAVLVTCVMMAVGGLMAWTYDFYKRKIAAALSTGSDSVYDELLPKYRRIHGGGGQGAGFVTRFGFAFDWMQVTLLQPHSRQAIRACLAADSDTPPASSTSEVAYIIQNAGTRRLRTAMRALSLMSGDNVMTLLNLGTALTALLASQATGYALVISELAVIVYGIATLVVGVALCNGFLERGRSARVDGGGRSKGDEPREVHQAVVGER